LSRLIFFTALALLLMVADARFRIVQPVRSAIAAVLYPVQWLALQPVQAVGELATYLTDLKTARKTEAVARRKLTEQSLRAGQVEQLQLENKRLRDLLGLRERAVTSSIAAQVLYDVTDPYSRRVRINKGKVHGIVASSPVMDESGVLGQVTRVYPFNSEITLLIDREQVIPVINVRTGTRSVAYGDPSPYGGMLELRYMSAAEDVQEGDLLTTSGIDGVYPPGLPVAKVVQVERRGDSGFVRVQCAPVANLQGVLHVIVLAPLTIEPEVEPASASAAAAPATVSPATTAPAVSPPAAAASPARAARSASRRANQGVRR
jgi:rod shape-determining protein MreC